MLTTYLHIRTTNVDNNCSVRIAVPHTNFKSEAEYLAELIEEADFSKVGAVAIFEPSGLYCCENHDFPKYFVKRNQDSDLFFCVL